MMLPRSLLALACASLLSGAAALVFQTLWTRAFAIILGSTVQAAAVTFSAFLCGLALGAQAAGAGGARLRRPLLAYAGVEGAIAIAGLLTGLLLHAHADSLAVGLAWEHPLARVGASFFSALVLLALPTFFMGATFPLMVAAWKDAGGNVRDVALVYGFNVFGAACGALVSGYYLIRLLGVSNSLVFAAACNLAAAALALAVSRSRVPAAAQAPEPMPAAMAIGERPLLCVVFLSGFLVLGLEIAWARLASFFLGNRIFAITTLLASILILLALGSFAASRLRRSTRMGAAELFSLAFAAAAAGCVLSSFASWYWIRSHEAIEAGLGLSVPLEVALRTWSCFILMAPVFLPLGVLFPLAISLAPRLQGDSSRVAGSYYLVNTAGAVLGALAVGFAGVRELGTLRSSAALAAVCALAAFGFHMLARREGQVRVRLAPVIAGASLLCALLVPGRIFLTPHAEKVVLYREDEYGVLQVIRLPSGHTRVVNNRTELVFHLGHPVTSYVQEMQGHLGPLFNPGARSAVVLGSGYGITAGALAAYPGLQRIDAVEIVPGMLQAAPLFEPFNHAYHRDPRVRLHADDGRKFLARSTERYDIISVNVSDPRLPGGSSLFHREFYDIVKARLAPGGVVIQHAFGEEIGIVAATLAASFPHLRLIPSYANGFNVVAALRPLDPDPLAIEALLRHEPVRARLAGIGVGFPVSIPVLVAKSYTPKDLPGLFSGGEIATDDRPLVEFSTAGNPFFSNQ